MMAGHGPGGPEVAVTYTLRLADDADPTEVTVVTPAFDSAFRFVDAYLATGAGELGESGRALALVGDLGSGKTHLARSLLDRIARSREDAILLKLDTPHSEFGFLFRNVLLEQFGRERLHDLVIDYYAQVTAERIGEEEAGPELAEEIRQGLIEGTLDPRKVVEHFHLTKGVLQDELRRMLRHLTEHSTWATALALMVMDELADDVWEWLGGGAPSDALRERGINRRLLTSADAYHTLSVLAFLGGRMRRRMVLVIDEFEKLLGGEGSAHENAVNSLEELVKVFIDSQGLLVYCGPPDSLTLVSRGTLQRTRLITPSPFTREQATLLIANRGRRVTPPVAESLVEMTDGNPREILSLFRRAEAIVSPNGRPVTAGTIKEAVRQRHEFPVDQVRTTVRRLLEDSGLDFRSDVVLAADTDPIDFWVRYADGRAAVAVLITRSLLSAGDDVHLERRVAAANASGLPCELIAVVNGHLTTSIRAGVSNLVGRQPILFDVQEFGKRFRATLETAIRRLAASADESVLDGLRERMDRLSRQQSATQNMIDQLHESMAGRLALATGPYEADEEVLDLPPGVAEQFDRASALTESTGELGGLLQDVFDNPAGGERSLRARRRLVSRELIEAAGTTMVQRLLVQAFRTRVAQFLGYAGPGGLTPDEREELQAICRTFEVTVQSLPSSGLSAAPVRAPEPGSRSPGWEDRGRALDELGRRVLQGVLMSARS
ncbi:hypothetical protein FH608_030465 [Nonomuraea phyllanthi]|uniref:Uncharacterized protein n=1 Tax=Nonomuraea phyllanthi TaxID=2219224 RepID=A0A5C4W217_9ACTN|nr:hypothetical protein [Nonomuraea phyllanthi]KAB8191576.1 hypothetical protein FH608_030465 [Nonomuraea phyllanthi]QFY13098.1 hypothetical protein GBF35_46895 [Nonomuraea phyllanthi]